MHLHSFTTDLAIVLVVASLTALATRLLRQSTIVGYLLAGLIVSPKIPIPLFADPERIHAMAEFGVVLVMFGVGLEFRLAKLARVLPTSGLSGVVQVSALIWSGFTLGQLFGWNAVESIFLGAGVAVSSTMVVTRVFVQHPPRRDVAEHVLGVLVIQDVLAIALIAAMTGVAQGGELSGREVAGTLLELFGVLVGFIVVGLLVIPRLVRLVAHLQSAELLAVFSMSIAFGLAALAEAIGYSVALGAFIGGILVAESGRAEKIEHMVAPMRDTFAGVFFVSIGMTVEPALALEALPLSLIVLAAVIGAQFFSITFTGLISGLGLRRSATSGLALGQIGEFSFILASIGAAAGVIRPELQPILVTVAVLSTFTTPLLLGKADAIVRRLDHLIPGRLSEAALLYESWTARARSVDPERPRPARRHLKVMIIDALALLVIMGLSFGAAPQTREALVETFGLTPVSAGALFYGAVAALSVPFMAGYLRSAWTYARLTAEGLPAPPDASPGVVRSVRAMVHQIILMGAIVGIGVPAVAVARPLLGAHYAVVLLALTLLASLVEVFRQTGEVQTEMRSGTGYVAARILAMSQGGAADDDAEGDGMRKRKRRGLRGSQPGRRVQTARELGPLVPDGATPIRIPRGAPAVGRSLAELDLRARTEALVVAIRREDEHIALPSSQDAFRGGDEVWLIGREQAVADARALLTGEAPAEVEGDAP